MANKDYEIMEELIGQLIDYDVSDYHCQSILFRLLGYIKRCAKHNKYDSYIVKYIEEMTNEIIENYK